MLGKKIVSFKKLAKKVKAASGVDDLNNNNDLAHRECLLKSSYNKEGEEEGRMATLPTTPTGFFALYVGEERQRCVVPTSYLSHPLFKILLEKAYDEFGFAQRNGLVVPCSVSSFQEVVNAVECNKGNVDLCKIFQEFA